MEAGSTSGISMPASSARANARWERVMSPSRRYAYPAARQGVVPRSANGGKVDQAEGGGGSGTGRLRAHQTTFSGVGLVCQHQVQGRTFTNLCSECC